MAPTQPAVPQRSVSFNPEAATFSPSSAKPTTTTTADTGSTPPPKVQEQSRVPDMFGEKSRFRSNRPILANRRYYQGAKVAYPLRNTARILEGVQRDAASGDTLSRDNINSPMLFPPLGSVCSARHGPDFSAPPVGELSASLGLPGAKRRNTTNDSPVQSHELRASDTDALAGMDARYLNGLGAHQGDLIPPSQGIQYGCGTRLPEREASEDQATKIVQPPPGFGRVQSRRIPAEESGAAALSVMERQYVPKGSDAMTQPRRFSDLPQYPQRASGAGNRHRPRAYTRGKRTDQGPEPSAADIYPEDASYVTRRSSYLQPAVPFLFPKVEPPPQPQFRVENPVSWPTPAEVHALRLQKPQTPRSLIRLFDEQFCNEAPAAAPAAAPPSPPTPFDIFADHSYPTQDDLNSADDDVAFLLSSIPSLYYEQEVGQTQARAQAQTHTQTQTQPQAQGQGITDLTCDTRALTPEQLTGARYGLRYYGIGLGDGWKCPEVKEGEPFRVRPRTHDGWGSWEWAINKGWAKE
ncbi:hypothetical protein PTNB73_04865 [Pyrenophora teres f. teres]|nr:hypothetical protein HRS9139_05573 [Pyrenophora teres f. teres]KAE8840475.1 hypothetical protein PTNB85_03874 [Pyrenophora teres f. teres]KAE8849385.1 hypothetical protein HRS9122_03401 [Pyrenophora teres f. teres]KAE8866771.1 hypothetical protein PTNB73_04865 [Pyrenophora teres f. teres]